MHKLASGAKLDLKVGGVVGGLGNEQRRIGYSPAGVQILDSTVLSKGTDRGVTSTGKFSTPMFEGHALSIGWDGGVSTSDGQRAEQGRPVEIFDARVNRLAAYAQDEWNNTPRLEAKFPLKSLAANAPALDLRASISRNWSSADAVPAPDNRLNAQVPFLATIGADYKEGALTTGGSFAFKTGGPVRISTIQSSYQSVRRALEVYGLWKFSPQNQLRMAMSNLLAQGYDAQTTYADASGTVSRMTSCKGPVVMRATMEMKF